MSTEEMPADMTDGFHLVVEALKLNGVDTIFGVAGIPITDLLRLAQAEGIRYLGFRHEQSAGNAAAIAGYLTQKPGLCKRRGQPLAEAPPQLRGAHLQEPTVLDTQPGRSWAGLSGQDL